VVIRDHPQLAEPIEPPTHQHLPGDMTDAGTARRFVRSQLADLDDELIHSAMLLTSELVSNAVLHAGGPTLLGVSRLPAHVLITVADDHRAALPKPRSAPDPEMLAESGRGFQIIAEIAEDFGWQTLPDREGRVAWFALRTAS
jgi:anti-sigma regulatory factor (Ser/Thr protein kinase)